MESRIFGGTLGQDDNLEYQAHAMRSDLYEHVFSLKYGGNGQKVANLTAAEMADEDAEWNDGTDTNKHERSLSGQYSTRGVDKRAKLSYVREMVEDGSEETSYEMQQAMLRDLEQTKGRGRQLKDFPESAQSSSENGDTFDMLGEVNEMDSHHDNFRSVSNGDKSAKPSAPRSGGVQHRRIDSRLSGLPSSSSSDGGVHPNNSSTSSSSPLGGGVPLANALSSTGNSPRRNGLLYSLNVERQQRNQILRRAQQVSRLLNQASAPQHPLPDFNMKRAVSDAQRAMDASALVTDGEEEGEDMSPEEITMMNSITTAITSDATGVDTLEEDHSYVLAASNASTSTETDSTPRTVLGDTSKPRFLEKLRQSARRALSGKTRRPSPSPRPAGLRPVLDYPPEPSRPSDTKSDTRDEEGESDEEF
jgi:hypothetical protein